MSRFNFEMENSLKSTTFLLAISVLMPISTFAQQGHEAHTPYADMQNRAIKSLSENDIKELRRGGGWGLALAAELNGMPGPTHLLELQDQIPLTQEQVIKTKALIEDMRKAAIPAGEKLIATETALESAFTNGTFNETSLRKLLAEAESAKAELRFIHLSQHLKTTQYLNQDQIMRYKALRGYTQEPCKNTSENHSPEMHKHHMGCK